MFTVAFLVIVKRQEHPKCMSMVNKHMMYIHTMEMLLTTQVYFLDITYWGFIMCQALCQMC